jgi:hypothetical protein
MPDQEQSQSPQAIVIKWLFGQPFNNVILIMIFGALGYGMNYAITIAIPAVVKQIQDGYETIDTANRIERLETRVMYDKWFDRLDKVHADTHTATAEK